LPPHLPSNGADLWLTEVKYIIPIAFWEDAKKRWDAGERNVRGNRCETVTDDKGEVTMHITRTSWGIGINMFEMDDEGDDGLSKDAG